MPPNHLNFCHPLLLPSIFPSIRVFSNEPVLRIRWPNYWSFSFNISPSNEHSGLISFRMDWLDLLAIQGTLKSSKRVFATLWYIAKLAYIPQKAFLVFVTLRSLQPYGLSPARLLFPWNSPGKHTGEGCHALLPWIFRSQGSNPHLLHFLHWQADSLLLKRPGNP